jgi:hypothetical protein
MQQLSNDRLPESISATKKITDGSLGCSSCRPFKHDLFAIAIFFYLG